ncbi:23S rRNA m(2)G2445 methyltransferase [Catenovulum agarivorans DS-2]|uniref:Ribosomal RNA large subunit methyltransferase K/L n=1 Tax=Catenovulum agarivorans DS-2 TaxID=1328313 RepID=W7Q751_9ALTE|nr:bifunctional 23S rRNA (guanine(2069)-N(7))-methyltransferase RlmK/23S rRNA (guanine(2445)-N(2))-methyltransferase RlmL [Catenovulum agarivorans]EWH08579.1 23S rRNA m(2)G2445 methyltransferase [Catenovulum agarivorans DS-2]
MAKFLVTTSKGLENLLESELTELGIENIKLSVSSVWFEGTMEQAYRLCYTSRLANKVLLELASGDCANKNDLYKVCQSVDWPMQFSDKVTLSVDFNGTNDALRNTQYSAQVIKDAICDIFNEELGRRPNVDKSNADIRIQGRLIKKQAHIFLDFSGASLHQRGYRTQAGRAPIKENIAAAVVMRSGWLQQPNAPLVDYFCGSGTLLIEAAQMACNMPAQQYRRKWGFDAWLSHNKALFEQIKTEYDQQIIEDGSFQLYGFDINNRELSVAKQNADDAGVAKYIHFERQNAVDHTLKVKSETGFIVSNPPYGERLEDQVAIAHLYLDFGHNIKQQHAGWSLTLISSAIDAMRYLKLSANKKYKVKNAALDCIVANYQIEAAQDTTHPREGLAVEFQNRLKKNFKQFSKQARQADTECYRVYDSDLPNYNVAIDIYNDSLVIYEYAAPKSVPVEKAQARLNEVLLTAPFVLGTEPSKIALKVRKKQKGNEQYKKAADRGEVMTVREGPAQFYVNLYDYLDTGLFLDHRDMRKLIGQVSQGKSVLNLFSYTCSVSVHAALGGATQVTSVDLSKKYLDWGKQNFELNGINSTWHPFIAMDSIDWLKRTNNKFDLIFIDPPSFSNSKKLAHDFDVQRDHIKLLRLALEHLNEGGDIYFSNNLRSFSLDESSLAEIGLQWQDLTNKTMPFDFKRKSNIRQAWRLFKTAK